MRITCPNCCESYPIEAGFADDDGKRLAALLAGVEPVLGRAIIGYLRLFKPAKSAPRSVRAAKLVEELLDLTRVGTVCRDARGGMRRPAPPSVWAAGIEQLLALPEKLRLPLTNHHYLRAVVFGLADQVDATTERARETDLRARSRQTSTSTQLPTESPMQNELAYLAGLLRHGALTQDDHDAKVAAARVKFGASV